MSRPPRPRISPSPRSSDRVAGLTAHVNADVTELQLTFDRDDAAREFAAAKR